MPRMDTLLTTVALWLVVAPAAWAQERVVWERTLTDEKQRAAQACTWNGTDWACAPEALRTFSVTGTATLQGETPAVLEVTPVQGNSGCLEGVEIAVSAPQGKVELDWTQVSVLHNATAVSTVPGFSRNKAVKVATWPVSTSPGRVLRQRIFPTDATACLAPAPALLGTQEADVVEVVIPHRAAGNTVSVTWRLTRKWIPTDEKAAFALVVEPLVETGAPKAAEPSSPVAPMLIGLLTLWGPAACVVPILGVVALGVGADFLDQRANMAMRGLYMALAGGVLLLVCFPACVMSAAAGAAADVAIGLASSAFGLAGLGLGTTVQQAAKQRAHNVKQSQLKHEAWVARRKALGIGQGAVPVEPVER